MEIWYGIINSLPFSWVEYDFMKNALLAVIVITPFFGLIGTAVVSNRMAFFSEGLGHSALTGIAIGVITGFTRMQLPMTLFAIAFAIVINILMEKTKAASDTVIAVFTSFSVALGIALLSGKSSFAKYTVYLIGDILSVSPSDILHLFILAVLVIIYFYFFSGDLTLIGIDPSLVYARRFPVYITKTLFSILLAVVVVLSIRWVGILIISSLFILPSASARIISASLRGYYFKAMAISLISGICGLFVSYYTGSSCGASIVLCAAVIYAAAVVISAVKRT